jgi:hypothetical protein
MGPAEPMNTFASTSNPDTTMLSVPKLRDDGSNWCDYQPRIERAMGSKGLWRHVLGTAVAPKPYKLVEGVPILPDGKTEATEEQIESKEAKISEYEKKEYLAQHIILSTTSTRLGSKMKALKTAKEMWDVVVNDVTTKSTLFLLDAEEQLMSMKLSHNSDPKAHLAEMNQHFQLMLQRQENLIKMGSTISDARFNTLIMSSLPESYRPTLQTITAAERASALTGSSKKMTANDLIDFFMEEAQHRVINDERSKNSDVALAASLKKDGKGKSRRKRGNEKESKDDNEVVCYNCDKPGHKKADCWSKGGGKEGQGPGRKKSGKSETAVVAVADNQKDEMFAFSCTSDFVSVAEALQTSKLKLDSCIDSGASDVYSPHREKFTNYRQIDRDIMTADGRKLKAIGMGDLEINLPNGTSQTTTMFKDSVHAPEMAFTLISISKLDKAKHKVIFHNDLCTIINPKGKTIGRIPHSEGLYRIASADAKSQGYAATASGKMSISEAHKKLGHISYGAITHAISKGLITGIELDTASKPEFCEACAKAKSARQPFPKESKTRATKYGERVHWDLWGPASIKSLAGNSYVAARIDDATRETRLYFQANKSQTVNSYKMDEAYIETQTGNRIKVVRSDRGGEFLSDQMVNHQNQRGTIRELTVHDSPPQNGVAERGMRTRAERARTLLIASGLPRFLWEEAMKHTTWLQNRTPARALDGKTPYEMLNRKKPFLGGIQEFGAAAYVKDIKAGKLDSRAQQGRFVGYDSESKGYRIYWPTKRSVTVERNVVFNEKDVLATESTTISLGVQSEGERDKVIQYPENSSEKPEEVKDQSVEEPNKELVDDENPKPNTITFPSIQPDPEVPEEDEDQNQYGRGRRTRRQPGEYRALNEGLTAAIAFCEEASENDPEEIFDNLPPDFALVGSHHSDPITLVEALKTPEREHWEEALKYEIGQLEKLGTWDVVDLPPGHIPIPCSGVTRVKRGPNGEVQSYRVRIVAGGHKQVEGINYTETFSAAAKMPTVRAVLANAAHQDWEIEHVDVKSAYLNAPLKETIFMRAPMGVLKPGQEGKVLRLKKGLYGLKQAGRGWYQEMSRVFLNEMKFSRSEIDHSVFYKRTGKEHTIIAVATDDMAVTSKRKEDAVRFKAEIQKYWAITDHGAINWFLGFEIKRDRKARTISINQQALSSTEAEYIAQTHGAKEAIWLRNFVSEMEGTKKTAITMLCDNQGAIALAKDNKFHSRTKHIDLRYHFIREAVEDGKIKVEYIPTAENVADIFTKPLSKPKFQEFVKMLGLRMLETSKVARIEPKIINRAQTNPIIKHAHDQSCD